MAQNGKLKKNLLYNISYQILVIILPLITAPYVSRVLGSHNVGVYSYTQAYEIIFRLSCIHSVYLFSENEDVCGRFIDSWGRLFEIKHGDGML